MFNEFLILALNPKLAVRIKNYLQFNKNHHWAYFQQHLKPLHF